VVGGEAVIVAGIGCRKGCPAEDILALVARAEALSRKVDALAAPAFKHGEAGLREAASRLGVPLYFVADEIMRAAQARCPTVSMAASAATGLPSVAEAAAIGADGTLLLPRIASARATCAIGERR
jgi:cobalt-precorrin 5A hydrolase